MPVKSLNMIQFTPPQSQLLAIITHVSMVSEATNAKVVLCTVGPRHRASVIQLIGICISKCDV